jgi:hypothetical protein
MNNMLKPLLLIALLLNTKTTEKAPINNKFPSAAATLQQLDKEIDKGSVEINYVIDGCASLMIYKICLDKKGNNYALELSIPPTPQGVLHDYDELIKEVVYYKTYTISPEKLKELKSALVPMPDVNSTTHHNWTIHSINDSLSFSDRAGGHGIVRFIHSLAKEIQL